MRQREMITQPYDFAALLIMGVTFVVAVFYCLDALHGERRDRSILFWKSLPVSDFDYRAFESQHSPPNLAVHQFRHHPRNPMDHAHAEQCHNHWPAA